MKKEIETLEVTLFFDRYLPDNRSSDQLMDDILQAVEAAKPTDATKDFPTADVIKTDEGPLYKRDFSCTFGAPKPHGPMWKVRLKRIRDFFLLSIGSHITDWLTFWKWGPWILPPISSYHRVRCEVTIQSNWLCAFVEQGGKCHPIEHFDMYALHKEFKKIEGFSDGYDAFGSAYIEYGGDDYE
tara:strand:- start:3374 stop:3925 length:552 start_codon:yes stop_codon:yes gene_type:complete